MLRIAKSRIINLFLKLGCSKASKWTDDVLEGRVATIHEVFVPSMLVNDPYEKMFTKLYNASRLCESVEIVDDSEEPVEPILKSVDVNLRMMPVPPESPDPAVLMQNRKEQFEPDAVEDTPDIEPQEPPVVESDTLGSEEINTSEPDAVEDTPDSGGKLMSVLDAVCKVLVDAGTPLKVRVISKTIIEQGLWLTTGNTPEATVNASVCMDIKKKGGQSRFIKVSPSCYTVRPDIQPNEMICTTRRLRGVSQNKKYDSQSRFRAQSKNPQYYANLMSDWGTWQWSSGYKVDEFLLNDGQGTLESIADTLKLSVTTVRNQLGTLIRFGLVIYQDDGVFRAASRDERISFIDHGIKETYRPLGVFINRSFITKAE